MISMNKKYQTRDGKPVRLICIDETLERYPVIGIIDNDESSPSSWTKEGCYFGDDEEESSRDLVEIKEEKTFTGWVNLYTDGSFGQVYSSKEECKSARGYGVHPAFACVQVTLTRKEGDGL